MMDLVRQNKYILQQRDLVAKGKLLDSSLLLRGVDVIVPFEDKDRHTFLTGWKHPLGDTRDKALSFLLGDKTALPESVPFKFANPLSRVTVWTPTRASVSSRRSPKTAHTRSVC
jgi:hypothetical protein